MSHTLHPPTTLSNGFQFSIHSVPKGFTHDLAPILPGIPLTGDPPLLLVPTCQHSAYDLVNWGEEVSVEKDLLLERFAAWASMICDTLVARGWWGDYVDPCSGQAVRTKHSHSVYPEVDAFEALLKWKTFTAGGCKVLSHPEWQTSVYPATLFARAPLEVLLEVVNEVTAKVQVLDRDAFFKERGLERGLR